MPVRHIERERDRIPPGNPYAELLGSLQAVSVSVCVCVCVSQGKNLSVGIRGSVISVFQEGHV